MFNHTSSKAQYPQNRRWMCSSCASLQSLSLLKLNLPMKFISVTLHDVVFFNRLGNAYTFCFTTWLTWVAASKFLVVSGICNVFKYLKQIQRRILAWTGLSRTEVWPLLSSFVNKPNNSEKKHGPEHLKSAQRFFETSWIMSFHFLKKVSYIMTWDSFREFQLLFN